MDEIGEKLSSACTTEEVVQAVVRQYFLAEELTEARIMRESGRTHEEVHAYLAQCGQNTLRDSGEKDPPHWFFTIPNGKVFIYHPGHGFPEPPVVTVFAKHLAGLAFPEDTPVAQATHSPTIPQQRQLSFWDGAEVVPEDAVKHHVPQESKNRLKKHPYLERLVAARDGPPRQGWVVKDCGLGYYIEPDQGSNGYWVRLIHLSSRREIAVVRCVPLDHERIRMWVTACLELTDWTQNIQVLLAQQPGKHKQRTWSHQLEGMWQKQKTRGRQIALF